VTPLRVLSRESKLNKKLRHCNMVAPPPKRNICSWRFVSLVMHRNVAQTASLQTNFLLSRTLLILKKIPSE
jgi:hypothetical protein